MAEGGEEELPWASRYKESPEAHWRGRSRWSHREPEGETQQRKRLSWPNRRTQKKLLEQSRELAEKELVLMCSEKTKS